MTITLSHGGPTIFESQRPSDEVLVGTREGVVRLRRAGDGWQAVDTALADRHISALLLEPESGTLFAGAYHGSLHASEDGGRSWAPRDAGLSEPDVYSLAARSLPGGGVCLYAGTEPAHLFQSTDLGRSWSELPGLRQAGSTDHWTFPAPPHVAHLKHITFDPRDSQIIYASIEQGGLLKSYDGGLSWRVMSGMDDDVHRVVVSPQRPDRLYITGGDGVYVSEDAGETWAHWHTRDAEHGGYPDQLLYRPGDADLMFIGAAQSNPGVWRTSHFAGSRISRSRDGGRTWETLHNGLPDRLQSSIEAMALEDWGESFAIFAATTAGEVWYSGDGGESWTCAVEGLAPISKGGHYRNLVAV